MLKNDKSIALDKAYNIFLKALNEYAKNNGNGIDVSEIRQILHDVYTDKKLAYYIENKLGKFNNYLNDMLSMTSKYLNEKDDREFTKMFYLKHMRQILRNERY